MRWLKLSCYAVALAAATMMVLRLAAQPLVVAGSPGYDSTTGTGFRSAFAGAVNNAGVAVGYSEKFVAGSDVGRAAVRWDALGAATELGNLGADGRATLNARAYAVNSTGTAVGSSSKFVGDKREGTVAVRWDGAGTAVTELESLGNSALGFNDAVALAVNSAGTAVGYSQKFVGSVSLGYRAVRWDASGTAATELGNIGIAGGYMDYARATAVNDAGAIVGYAEKYVAGTNLGPRAVRWDASGTAATELANLGTDASGFTSATPLAVNSAGTAVGRAEKYFNGTDLGNRPVRWDASGTLATELGNLGTTSNGFTNEFIDAAGAVAVNNVGLAVGYCKKYAANADLGTRPVRWDVSGIALELGILGTDTRGSSGGGAVAVNDAGIAVGSCNKYDAGVNLGQRAVIWRPDGSMIDLNDLGVVANPPDGTWLLTNATAISADGWVAGYGTFTPTGGLPYGRGWVAHVSLPAMLPGDYNGNGIVDAADYTVWRDHLGQNFTLLNRDPSASGPIGAGGLRVSG